MLKCRLCDRPVCARGLCRPHYMKAWFKNEHLSAAPKDRDLKRRLLKKVRVLPNGCWEYTGQRRKDKFEYGLIWVNGKNVRAHRVSYEIHKGSVPEGLNVLHSCDYPPCINPDHLFVGTRAVNNDDAKQKGRNVKGRTHGAARFSEEDVRAIRASSENQDFLAKQYGVAQSTISRIRTRSRWKHL